MTPLICEVDACDHSSAQAASQTKVAVRKFFTVLIAVLLKMARPAGSRERSVVAMSDTDPRSKSKVSKPPFGCKPAR
jgi:hypothetical protein